jgi:mono/diheme cytochrome c family protein
MSSRHHLALLIAFALCIGCSGEGAEGEGSTVETAQPAPEDPPSSGQPTGNVDAELADRGQSLFQSKGCIGCHTIGSGRLTGPDLMGVVERREFDWIIAMMTNPDSMVKEDPVARQLFAEYMTPMLNMGVNTDDARAIYEFLRRDGQ